MVNEKKKSEGPTNHRLVRLTTNAPLVHFFPIHSTAISLLEFYFYQAFSLHHCY